MKRTIVLLTVIFFIFALPLGVFGKDKNELVICTFGGAFTKIQQEAYFDPFEKETGIKVIVTSRPNAAKLKAMVESGNVEWDIMLGASGIFGTAKKHNLLEKIDYRYFDQKTWDEVYPEAKDLYGVGNFYFSIVLGYRTDIFPKGKEPKSWTDFWNVAKYPGQRSLHSMSPCGCNWEFALQADGVPLNKLYDNMWPPAHPDMERVWNKFKEIKPHITKFWVQGAEAPQLLNDKEVVMTSVYNARIQKIKEEGAPVDYTFNGGMLYLEYMMIPKGAPNYENANKFLAFQARADRQAEFSKLFSYGPINAAAFQQIPEERARILPSYSENKKIQFFENEKWYGQNMEMMIQQWEDWVLKK